ncbi:MAG TPA: DUF2330 domain-containing protein [Alphaproteobacteria bacterium]|nr:DUF2330 domain-containing protein [Alphaproteobacteria bacterium]
MIRLSLVLVALIVLMPAQAQAFCGFYVAKADGNLFNEASKVVMSREGERTVMTMANDFKGDVDDFAIVIPVPTVIKKSQVNIGDSKLIDHLDAYTAPRLVEYYDENPCHPRMEMMAMSAAPQTAMRKGGSMDAAAKALGVTIEESFSVGEYDILILSAEESDGLFKWLNQEGYKLPKGAEKILGSYIKQDMKFFVAKVNLDEFESSGYTYLRPLQVAYESDKFMLPVRLGTLNSKGPQDLLLFTLTKKGRVEPTNYRTTKIPTGDDVPLFVADEFGEFYKAMFAQSVKREDMKTVMLEYAWDMAWCDPCAADPLPVEDLRKLGVWWLEQPYDTRPMPMRGGKVAPGFMPPPSGPVNAFVTRMHVRYDAETFPEDIMLQVTEDRENFQGRYVMRHPWTGEANCETADQYYKSLKERFENEAKNLAHMTGWDIGMIRRKMESSGQSFDIKAEIDNTPWWEQMWDKEK